MQKLLLWTTTMGILVLTQIPLLAVPKGSNFDVLNLEKLMVQATPSPELSPSPIPQVEETPSPETLPPTPEPSTETKTPEPSSMLLNEAGVLETGDKILSSDQSLYDEYTFNGQQGQQITISLESSEFDTYLAVFTPDNELLQEHDDIDQNNSNSQITMTLPKTGTYRVIVNAYDSKGKGKYLIKVQSD